MEQRILKSTHKIIFETSSREAHLNILKMKNKWKLNEKEYLSVIWTYLIIGLWKVLLKKKIYVLNYLKLNDCSEISTETKVLIAQYKTLNKHLFDLC